MNRTNRNHPPAWLGAPRLSARDRLMIRGAIGLLHLAIKLMRWLAGALVPILEKGIRPTGFDKNLSRALDTALSIRGLTGE